MQRNQIAKYLTLPERRYEGLCRGTPNAPELYQGFDQGCDVWRSSCKISAFGLCLLISN